MRPALFFAVLTGLVLITTACGRPPPKAAERNESVPANSLSDARLHGDDGSGKTETSGSAGGTAETQPDPTQPYTTKVGERPPSEAGASGGSGDKKTSKPGKEVAGGKGAVSQAECDRVMDKFIDLEVSKNPQLKDVSPEIIEQAKQAAREEHGDAPCTATRAQYTCAMSATSSKAWQRCMR